MARIHQNTPREGTTMNQNINDVLGVLASTGLPESTVIQIFVVEHQYLTLPEHAPVEVAAKPKSTARPKRRDPWSDVPNANAKKRAARMLAAHLRWSDVARYTDIDDREAKAVYDDQQALVDNAVKAYDALKLGRPGRPSRAAMWDAAYISVVLNGGPNPDDALTACRQWALRDWTLAEVGVTSNKDVTGAMRAMGRAIVGLPWKLNQIGF